AARVGTTLIRDSSRLTASLRGITREVRAARKRAASVGGGYAGRQGGVGDRGELVEEDGDALGVAGAPEVEGGEHGRGVIGERWLGVEDEMAQGLCGRTIAVGGPDEVVVVVAGEADVGGEAVEG